MSSANNDYFSMGRFDLHMKKRGAACATPRCRTSLSVYFLDFLVSALVSLAAASGSSLT